MKSRAPVWAQWVPLDGTHGRMPTKESVRRCVRAGGWELVTLHTNGLDVIVANSPEMVICELKAHIEDQGNMLYWLEGHPDEEVER